MRVVKLLGVWRHFGTVVDSGIVSAAPGSVVWKTPSPDFNSLTG